MLLIFYVAFTGKTRYEEGDIQRAVKREEEKTTQQQQQERLGVIGGDNESTNESVGTAVTSPLSQSTMMVPPPSPMSPIPQNRLNLQLSAEFEEWDKTFRGTCSEEELDLIYYSQTNNYNNDSNDIPNDSSMSAAAAAAARTMDIKVAKELEEWVVSFRKNYPDNNYIQ